MLAAASVIAKSTSGLCNFCKVATTKTQNPLAKNQFVAFAKAIAGCTGALVADIKTLATTLSNEARTATQRSSLPLMDAMSSLKVYAASPEFAATRGTISPSALRAQQPLVQANQLILNNAKQVVTAVRMLATNPADAEAVQLFSSQARGVAEGMRQLVNAFKNGAPGQKECDEAVHIVQDHVAMLDVAITMAATGALTPQEGPDFEVRRSRRAAGAGFGRGVAWAGRGSGRVGLGRGGAGAGGGGGGVGRGREGRACARSLALS